MEYYDILGFIYVSALVVPYFPTKTNELHDLIKKKFLFWFYAQLDVTTLI